MGTVFFNPVYYEVGNDDDSASLANQLDLSSPKMKASGDTKTNKNKGNKDSSSKHQDDSKRKGKSSKRKKKNHKKKTVQRDGEENEASQSLYYPPCHQQAATFHFG